MDKAINSLKSIEIYCNKILERPTGVYSTESVIIADVIKDYAQEGLRALKDE